MWALLTSPLVKALGAFLAGAALCAGIYAYGHHKGRQAGRIEILEDTVDAYQDRAEVDGKIGDLDRFGLCVELGGLPDECEQLRGVEAH